LAAIVPPVGNAKEVVMRGGKTTRDPSYPNHAGTSKKSMREVEECSKGPSDIKEHAPGRRNPIEERTPEEEAEKPKFIETNILPFPQQNRKTTVDKQVTCFVEMIPKVYINFLLLEAMRVPTYACYLKDILTNKRAQPMSEVVNLTEECSAAILNRLP
jgi:hypothetical protein